MSKKVILAIIVLMTGSLIGVGVIQFFWIKRSVDLEEKNFNDKVYSALNMVRNHLKKDAEEKMDVAALQNSTTDIAGTKINWRQNQRNRDMESMTLLLDPNHFLETVDKEMLDKLLRKELEDLGILIPYEYGVFSKQVGDYIIINGNYVATAVADTTKSSNLAAINPLAKAEYKVSLFSNEIIEPGYLNLYFPGKTRFLWSSFIPILLLSSLFTGLLLFCFSFTIYIIFRQKKVSSMKTDFINNMTHEFKTPIATISLASDSILSPGIIDSSEKVKRFIGIIKQENARMLQQVEHVLQVAQLDKKEIQLKYELIDIHELIEGVVVNAELKIQSRGGKIEINLLATKHHLTGDKSHLTNLVSNLLDNAEKYTVGIPEIIITTRNTRKGVDISISDNGIGIPKDAQKHIFERFYRVHTGNLHDVKGFGLGLSYVKDIVDAHGGRISVKSELGKGSTFHILLPISGVR